MSLEVDMQLMRHAALRWAGGTHSRNLCDFYFLDKVG